MSAAVLSLMSCDLDEQTFTFVSGEDVAANKGYQELVNGAYATLEFPHEWGNYHTIVNFDCDYQTGPTWAFGSIGAGNFYNEGSNNNHFQYLFQSVHRANYHYYLVNKISGISDKIKNNALGELKFLRAWAYFQLVQNYGGVPLYEKSISEGNVPEQPRASVAEVYESIISSLKEAEELLMPRTDESYIKGHVCRGTAKALLAKVYATIGSASMKDGYVTVKGGPGEKVNPDGTETRLMPVAIRHKKDLVAGYEGFDSKEYYKLALEKAREVIKDGEFELAPSQEKLWDVAYKNGPEFEFCLQTKLNEGTLYANYTPNEYLGYPKETEHGVWSSGYYVQRDHWLQTFDDWDDDRIQWGVMHRWPYYYIEATGELRYMFYPERDSVYVKKGERGYSPSDVKPVGAHNYGSKLKKFGCITVNDGNRADYNWPYMRYAETLLIFAEADNEVNGKPSAEAMAIVDKLNSRNHSTLCSKRNEQTPFTQESFRSYILEERAKEFAAEGIRRQDLIRWGIYLQVMNAIGTVDENGVIKRREKKHLLLPLPPDEVNTNPYIETNNPGW